MTSHTPESAEEFVRRWCALFLGDEPDVDTAMAAFDPAATVFLSGVPYRVDVASDHDEIRFSHLVDGRGHVHFWHVLEPAAVIVGDVAIVTYYARYNIGRLGESTTKFAKETLILGPARDTWSIVHLHNSPA